MSTHGSQDDSDYGDLLEVRKRMFQRIPLARNPLGSDFTVSPSSSLALRNSRDEDPADAQTSTPSPAPLQRQSSEATLLTPERPSRTAPLWAPQAAAVVAAAAASAVCTSVDDEATDLLWRRLVERPLPRNPLSSSGTDTAATSLNSEASEQALRVVFLPIPTAQASGSGSRTTTATPSAAAPVTPLKKDVELLEEKVTPEPASETIALGRSYVDETPCRQLFQETTLQSPSSAQSLDEGQTSTLPATSIAKVLAKASLQSASEICIEDSALVAAFESINAQLRRNGFGEVPHHLEPVVEKGPSSRGGVVRLVADVSSVWMTCSEVLDAYEDRGRKLREALLAARSEDRHKRDVRVKELLAENAKLQEELKAALSTRLTGSGIPASAAYSANSKSTSDASVNVAELQLRLRTAEATIRQREKEFEKLRTHLENARLEESRRQEREKAALSRPLRRRPGATVSSLNMRGVTEDLSLEAAVAQRARAEALQAEVSSLTKQVHTLSFRLEESETKVHQLEVQKSRQPALKQSLAFAGSQKDVTMELKEQLRREQELRAQAEEHLRAEHERHALEVRNLSINLQKSEETSEQLRAEIKSAGRQPTASELRWQREALRLRDDLAEVRKTWRACDSRGLMQRDKELARLGLDAKALEETAMKCDLVSTLLDLCRILHVSDISQLPTEVGSLTAKRKQHSPRITLEVKPDISEAVLWKRVAEKLGFLEGTSEDECLRSVDNLRLQVQSLKSIAEKLKCESPEDIAARVESLTKFCDERVAAQRIVEALQKLLRVQAITEVLPALKEVLDVGALRQKFVRSACETVAASKAGVGA